MAERIKVRFIGGIRPLSTEEVWGGTKATFHAIESAFRNDPDIDMQCCPRTDFIIDNVFQPDRYFKYVANCDIIHVDDTSILGDMFKARIKAPDVAGPISRSPIKVYKDWNTVYDREYFYSAKIMRLNYNEERKNHELVTLIRHGVDTDLLRPVVNPDRKYVLWAGMIARPAKNYAMMEKIMEITKLPPPYGFKVMSKYNIGEYWKMLDHAAILVNTSLYESFCCALFEARAKGVATIQPELLNGVGVHENAPIQVKNEPEVYRDMILNLLSEKSYVEKGDECRRYCVENASLKIMRDDMYGIYRETYGKKHGK